MTPETQQPFAYVRLKIYDPERGYKLLGFHIYGWHFKGGDGVSTIPEWVPVNRKQAVLLDKVRQSDNSSAPKAFDIVDPQMRVRIDQAEELERRFRLGLIPRPVSRNAPMALTRGGPRSPAVVPRLEDLEDDASMPLQGPDREFAMRNFSPPTIMGQTPVEDSHSHNAFSSIASQEVVDMVSRNPAAYGSGPASPGLPAVMSPAARATIEALQAQVMELSRQIATISSMSIPETPAALEPQAQAFQAEQARRAPAPAPLPQVQPPEAEDLPIPMRGRLAALTELEPPAPTLVDEPEVASPSPTSVAPTDENDPAFDDAPDPEADAVFRKGENLVEEAMDDGEDAPLLRDLGIRGQRNLNEDKSDPDLDAALAEANEEAEAEAKAKAEAAATTPATTDSMAAAMASAAKPGKPGKPSKAKR